MRDVISERDQPPRICEVLTPTNRALPFRIRFFRKQNGLLILEIVCSLCSRVSVPNNLVLVRRSLTFHRDCEEDQGVAADRVLDHRLDEFDVARVVRVGDDSLCRSKSQPMPRETGTA
jgi:hypothetical protein